MTGNDYQKLAMRTNDHNCTTRLVKNMQKYVRIIEDGFNPKNKLIETEEVDIGGVLNACLGLSGEVGEFNDMIKKWIFHEKELDIEHAKKEAGDICWYLAMLCESFCWDLDEIMQMNVDKLKARYPEGFDVDRANNRAEGDV